MRRRVLAAGVALFLLLSGAGAASAFDFDLHGSMKEGGPGHYVPPVSNPLFNETPYITTELRPIFIYHDIADDFITGGGRIHVVAAEVRVALNDRLGIIATKDGYFDLNFDGVLQDDDGFANISLGVKYAIVNNPSENRIVTVGLEYEPPSGNLITSGIRLQGTADGFLDMFLSAAETWDKIGLEGNIGLNLALDPDRNSSLIHASAHVDYEILPGLFPLAEVNLLSVVDDGARTPVGFEGLDIVNLGSGPVGPGPGGAGAGTIITMNVGGRYKIMDHILVGAGYEFPISTTDVDMFGWRMTSDVVIYY